jgi:hypothetical protein
LSTLGMSFATPVAANGRADNPASLERIFPSSQEGVTKYRSPQVCDGGNSVFL